MRAAFKIGGDAPKFAVYTHKGNGPHMMDPRALWSISFGMAISDMGSGFAADMGDQGLFEVFGLFHIIVQGNIGEDALTLDVVGESDNRRFRDISMRREGRFDFRGAQPVTGNIDNVIDTAGDFVIAVGIAFRAVAGEVSAGELHEVIFDKPAIFVIPQTAGDAGP